MSSSETGHCYGEIDDGWKFLESPVLVSSEIDSPELVLVSSDNSPELEKSPELVLISSEIDSSEYWRLKAIVPSQLIDSPENHDPSKAPNGLQTKPRFALLWHGHSGILKNPPINE
eukprot:gene7686-biopygen14303